MSEYLKDELSNLNKEWNNKEITCFQSSKE